MRRDKKPGWSFWRDEAKLSFLQPENRIKFLIAMLGSGAGIALIFAWPVRGEELGTEELIVRSIFFFIAVAICPAWLATEMFFKGRRAGNRLKTLSDDAEKSNKELEESHEPQRLAVRLVKDSPNVGDYSIEVACTFKKGAQQVRVFVANVESQYEKMTSRKRRQLVRGYKSDDVNLTYGYAEQFRFLRVYETGIGNGKQKGWVMKLEGLESASNEMQVVRTVFSFYATGLEAVGELKVSISASDEGPPIVKSL